MISQGVSVNGELRFSASQWGVGDYYAWITASNLAGNVDSVGINFSVVGAAGYNSVSVENHSMILMKQSVFQFRLFVQKE